MQNNAKFACPLIARKICQPNVYRFIFKVNFSSKKAHKDFYGHLGNSPMVLTGASEKSSPTVSEIAQEIMMFQ